MILWFCDSKLEKYFLTYFISSEPKIVDKYMKLGSMLTKRNEAHDQADS